MNFADFWQKAAVFGESFQWLSERAKKCRALNGGFLKRWFLGADELTRSLSKSPVFALWIAENGSFLPKTLVFRACMMAGNSARIKPTEGSWG